MILHLVFWVGLFVGLTMLVVWAIRRARLPAANVSYADGGPTAKEILQARYDRGEVSPEQYEIMKQDLG